MSDPNISTPENPPVSAFEQGAEAMRAAIAANLERWVETLRDKGGRPTMSGCNFASARVVALLTPAPTADAMLAERAK